MDFQPKDWKFELRAVERRVRRGGQSQARGHVAVLLKNVPSCRALVAELKQLEWYEKRDTATGPSESFCVYALRAEIRGSIVWAVGSRVTGGAGEPNETEAIKPLKIGAWPGIAACGRPG